MPGDNIGISTLASRENRGLELSGAMGALIKEERERRGWTAQELGNRMEMGQSGISTWENGGRHYGGITLHNIEALEIVFGMPPGAIFWRLGVVQEIQDFETFLMSRPELNTAQKKAFRDLHKVMTTKDWTE